MGNYLKYENGQFINKIGGGVPKLCRARNSSELIRTQKESLYLDIIETAPCAQAIDCDSASLGFFGSSYYPYLLRKTQFSKRIEFRKKVRRTEREHYITIIQEQNLLIFKNPKGCSWSYVYFNSIGEANDFITELIKGIEVRSHNFYHMGGFVDWINAVYTRGNERQSYGMEYDKFYEACGAPFSPEHGASIEGRWALVKCINLLEPTQEELEYYNHRKVNLFDGISAEAIAGFNAGVAAINSRCITWGEWDDSIIYAQGSELAA